MNNFFQRGGFWVLMQGGLLAAVILLTAFFRSHGFPSVVVIVGVALLVMGAGVALAGVLALRSNLTPFPKPGARAQLVQHGIYAMIRHPLYLSALAERRIRWFLPTVPPTVFVSPRRLDKPKLGSSVALDSRRNHQGSIRSWETECP